MGCCSVERRHKTRKEGKRGNERNKHDSEKRNLKDTKYISK
jgi:hypothetical protein